MRKCVFCGRESTTKDHLPTKNLHKGLNITNLITVPSCRECNSGISKDEEFFRNVINLSTYGSSENAKFIFENSIARSIRERPRLGSYMHSKMIPLEGVFTKNGDIIEEAVGFVTDKRDNERISTILDKHIKGLFYFNFNIIMPNTFMLTHFPFEKAAEHMQDEISKFQWVNQHEGVFTYGFNYVPDNLQSIWCLVFYDKPISISFVMDHKVGEVS